MRINQIINGNESIFEDKAFVKMFMLLLGLIISISLFLIYHSLHQVSDLSLYSLTQERETPLSLGMVEEQINGNVISLEVLEDNFSDLAEKDLYELETIEQKSVKRKKPQAIPAPVSNQAKKHTAKAIEITSVIIKGKAPVTRSFKWLKKKFYATNNVKYALDIAKRFYASKKYDKALKWSLIANEVDQKNAESWILFAKTKVKMGKKQDAVNILNAYLKTYSSRKVSTYLKTIKSS